MNSRDFMYWLRGFMEAHQSSSITNREVNMINNHLQLAIQTEADAKRLSEDYDRARMAKMLAESGANEVMHSMAHRGPAAGC